MKRGWLRRSWCALAGMVCLAMATAASAQVTVTVQGNTADAMISLTGSNGVTYDADVTIVFDTPQHLTPRNLNLTAEIIDPNSVVGRLPVCVQPICPTVDPNFPVMITVEPLDTPMLFVGSFDSARGVETGLSFLNTYQIDVHTHDLVYQDGSLYRLYKAPLNQNFDDVTNDVMPGSVRVRGRGGAFSQFIVVSDPRPQLGVALGKIVTLNARILVAAINNGLQLQLLQLLAEVDTLILIDVLAALDVLGDLIDLINENAGTNIANVWDAHHDVVNDAGEMDQIAYTLQFSMERLLGGSAKP